MVTGESPDIDPEVELQYAPTTPRGVEMTGVIRSRLDAEYEQMRPPHRVERLSPTEQAVIALQEHKFGAQSTGESGVTVCCTCSHQSTAPGFRAAREQHYAHVVAAVVEALGLTEEWGVVVADEKIPEEVVDSRSYADELAAERCQSCDHCRGALPKRVVARLIGPWVSVEQAGQ